MRWKWILGLTGLGFALLIVILYAVVVSYDYNKLKARLTRIVHEATGRELSLGDIKVAFGFSPSLQVEKVGLQNAPWGSRTEMARIERLEFRVALLPLPWRELQFKRLILVKPDILLETDRSGRSNLEFKSAKPGEKLPPLTFKEVRIEGGLLTYKEGKGGKRYTVKIDTLRAALPVDEKAVKLEVQGKFNGRPFEVRGSTGPIGDLINSEKAWPVNLTARAAEATIIVKGSITDVLKKRRSELTISADGPSIRKVAEFGGATNIPDFGPFKVTAGVANPAGRFDVTDLEASFGENDIAGSFQLDLSGEIPQIVADLSSQRLDLRPLLGRKGEKAAENKHPGQHKPDRVFPDDPIPLDWLEALDARVKMQAGALRIPGTVLTEFRTDALLKKGNLTLKRLNFVLSGGRFDGALGLLSRGKEAAFVMNLRVDGLDISSLLKELEAKPLLEGKLSAEIELNGRGGSVAQWMAGLNGQTVAVMGHGRLNMKYLDLLGADLAQSLLGLINPFRKEEDYTELHCLVNGFEIKDGLATCSALVLDTDQTSVVGAGKINLKDETLNLSLQPSPKKGVGLSGLGKISLSLGELTKPFKLGGTLANPSLVIDPKGTITMIGKAIGGMFLFGPAGILVALASASPGDENPCLTALKAAKGGKAFGKAKAGEKSPRGKEGGEEAKGGSISIGETLRRLFKN